MTQHKPPRVAGEPRIVERSSRRVAVVCTKGDRADAARTAIPALYRCVYALKLGRARDGRDFPVEPLRARWPSADEARHEQRVALWALPVPDDVEELPREEPGVELQTWEYGPTAEVLHEGRDTLQSPDVLRLHALVAELGYEVTGAHEEEYLSRPRAERPRTLVRYPVRRRR